MASKMCETNLINLKQWPLLNRICEEEETNTEFNLCMVREYKHFSCSCLLPVGFEKNI